MVAQLADPNFISVSSAASGICRQKYSFASLPSAFLLIPVPTIMALDGAGKHCRNARRSKPTIMVRYTEIDGAMHKLDQASAFQSLSDPKTPAAVARAVTDTQHSVLCEKESPKHSGWVRLASAMRGSPVVLI